MSYYPDKEKYKDYSRSLLAEFRDYVNSFRTDAVGSWEWKAGIIMSVIADEEANRYRYGMIADPRSREKMQAQMRWTFRFEGFKLEDCDKIGDWLFDKWTEFETEMMNQET